MTSVRRWGNVNKTSKLHGHVVMTKRKTFPEQRKDNTTENSLKQAIFG